MKTCLAFDPAPNGYAYAVSSYDGRAFTLVDSGERAGTRTELRAHIRTLVDTHAPTITAVEGVAGFISAARQSRQRSPNWDISDLVQTAVTAGFLQGVLLGMTRAAPFTLPANNAGRRPSWRAHLTRDHRAGDKEVAHALNFHLRGGLPVKARKADGTVHAYAISNHVRDALGLAVVATLTGTGA
ncbi:hypothetical protein [Deinococcus kurensis]|uniref:hypothetical protein n=1 Tax=Deinococcus kurensis TaxID=2662757 RepID=UPI0012D2C4D9|nr:hypothetical protein [Deinococcus kurensis]